MADKKTSVWTWVAVIVVIAAVVGAAVWAIMAFVVDVKVKVPRVIGGPPTEASSLLEAADLKMSATKAFSADVPKGLVVEQDPKPGTQVKKGAVVSVVVSEGPEMIKVPRLSGMTRENAEAKINAVQLRVGNIVWKYSFKAAEDIVVNQKPSADTTLPRGQTVDITVSKGVRTTTVPNVVGRDLQTARGALSEAGLITNVTRQSSMQQAAGTVMSQAPVADNIVRVNTVATLVVSSGPAEITMPRVRGLEGYYAINVLENLDLRVQPYYVPASSTKVVNQQPQAGTQLRQGAQVKIWIGTGQGP